MKRFLFALAFAALAFSQTGPARPAAVNKALPKAVDPKAADALEQMKAKLAADEHKLADWAGLTAWGSEDTEVAPPKPGENRVIFLGTTLTARWGKGSAPFFPNKPYFNRGVEDQTTPMMLVRFRQDVLDLKPKVVVIQTGIDDIGMVAGPGSEGTIVDGLRSMIELAKFNGVKVVIASLTPTCDCYKDQKKRRPVGKIFGINLTLRDLAKETGSVYLNYWGALADPTSREFKPELTSDGLIPNDAGYQLLAPLAEAAIAQALQ